MSLEIPSFNKDYSESETLTFVNRIIEMLSKLQESEDFFTISLLFQQLRASYKELPNYRAAICREVANSDLVFLTAKFINKCHDQGYFVSDDVLNPAYSALNCLANFSDENVDIINDILSTDLVNLLICNIINKRFKTDQDLNIEVLKESSIGIIYNIVRSSSTQPLPQVNELKQELLFLVKRDESDLICTLSMLALACLLKDDELHLLAEGKYLIEIIVSNIETALNNNKKRINGFSIWELLNGLSHISVNDKLKKTIVKENGILILLKILESPGSEIEIEKSLKILWNLCFNEKIKADLIKNFNLKAVVERFADHKSPKIKYNVQGILWSINGETKNSILRSCFLSEKDFKFDIFMSYSRNDKQTVWKIVNNLKKLNIHFWIDDEQMTSSTLQAMATGIEKSRIFVMAMSNGYYVSQNCRAEAEHAYRLNKPIIPVMVDVKFKPPGWLRFIMGSKFVHEFSVRRSFVNSIEGLTKNIDEVLSSGDHIIIEEKVIINTDDSVIVKKCEQNAILDIEKWSNQDVEIWLKKNGLGYFTGHFSNICGHLLASMIDLNFSSPDFLYANLKSEYRMQFEDILKFRKAIKELYIVTSRN